MFGCTSYDHDLGIRAEDSAEGDNSPNERPKKRNSVRRFSASQTNPSPEQKDPIPSLILTYPTPEHSRSSEFVSSMHDPEDDRMVIGEFADRSLGQVVGGSLFEEHGYNRRLWPDAVESSVFTGHAHENTLFARRRRVPHPLAEEVQPSERRKRWSLASHTSGKRSTASAESSASPWRRLSSLLSVSRPSKNSSQTSTAALHDTACLGPSRRLEVFAGLESRNDTGQDWNSDRERDTGTSTLDPARAAGKDEGSIEDLAGGKDIRSRLRRLPGRIFVFRDEVAARTFKRFNFLLRSNGDQSGARRRHSLPPDFAFS
ncbi:hypothetical protein BKA70DRAFT_1269439 [Coprinopsis sp. MPI-PUGE-AT-0042]|nr:hypothetical protein BKA70DRAFT_1269439 [Coprinopsis sp. MPI-PUGE-AT-0042]